jgi:hypothetical protein
MIKVECNNCKLESYVEMYFYDERLICRDSAIYDSTVYEALVTGKAICPHCGTTINKQFRKYLNVEDIIKLAVGEQR